MSFILNIDTAIQTSSVCLAQNGKPLRTKTNPSPKDSAAWLHVAIEELLNEENVNLYHLDAIAVSEGPGSYTGLRVGMATAKGLCYVLNKPLIAINTLVMMASAGRDRSIDLICPMIDARRMEVFTAVFDQQLNVVLPFTNLIVNENSFSDLLQKHKILFFGNGSPKLKAIMKHANADFESIEVHASSMAALSFQKFNSRQFADLAYSQPFYGKDFHSFVKQSL